jgi:DNA invertase Pin-like site-specific DNA recombinase
MAKSKNQNKPKTIAYLRVSTIDQDTKKNKAEILKLANDRDLGKVVFFEEKASGKKSWKEKKIKGVIDDLGDGDRLLVPQLSHLGRSMLEIMEMLSITLLSSSGSCRNSTPATEKT